MLKERLYYENPYCKSFTTHIVNESQDNDGNQFVVLDNTTFYPIIVVQTSDRGTLNGVTVLKDE
mgnify:CR=1 FL=1